jgi:hypothetical protein
VKIEISKGTGFGLDKIIQKVNLMRGEKIQIENLESHWI